MGRDGLIGHAVLRAPFAKQRGPRGREPLIDRLDRAVHVPQLKGDEEALPVVQKVGNGLSPQRAGRLCAQHRPGVRPLGRAHATADMQP